MFVAIEYTCTGSNVKLTFCIQRIREEFRARPFADYFWQRVVPQACPQIRNMERFFTRHMCSKLFMFTIKLLVQNTLHCVCLIFMVNYLYETHVRKLCKNDYLVLDMLLWKTVAVTSGRS